MSDHIDKTVLALQQKIEGFNKEINKVKTTINQLLEVDGRSPMYEESDLQSLSDVSMGIRLDEFFGKPLATCVKNILDRRNSMNQVGASIEEIYRNLFDGGFDFENKKEAIAKRNVAITLGKNSAFQRTPNGIWGMRTWYGGKIKKSARNKSSTGEKDNLGDKNQEE